MKLFYSCTFFQKSFSVFILLVTFFHSQAQTTPVSGTTTFTGITNWNYIEYAQTFNGTSGFQANNVQSSGWDIRGYTSGPDHFVIAGENWGSNSDGGFVYLALSSGSSAIVSMRFKPNDGKLFDLNALDLGYDAAGGNIGFTITGYRNNVSVPGAKVIVPAFASFNNGGDWKRNISIAGCGNFKGIDEFRITPNSPSVLSALDIDNINATNFRTASFAQITLSDIPVYNEGEFNKTIAGHTFTFTPSEYNWVDYINMVGTEGFGGLYSYDYMTTDGTETTLTPPAGYTFDLNHFQYISDRGDFNLTVTLTFRNNSTDTRSYVLNGNSLVQTFTGFITAADDVKSIRLVTDELVFYNNFEISDIKTLSTLPLRWLKFSATPKDEQVLLNWKTIAEEGTKDFLVQHSTNGLNWTAIAIVDADGHHGGEQTYSYLHLNPATGLNSYRLMQRDHDGQFSYSPIVSVNLKATEQVQAYPNPVTGGTLNLRIPAPAMLRIYNHAGQIVMNKKLAAGISTVDVHHLSKGTYIAKIGEKNITVIVQ